MRSFLAKGSRRGGAAGFTLVEILVVVALTGVVAAAVYKALASQQKVYSVQDQAVEMQEDLRAAVNVMAKDIRMAGCDPRGSGQAGFLTAAAHTLRVGMDVPSDYDGHSSIEQRCNGNITDRGEDITYSFTPDAGSGMGPVIRTDAVTGRATIADNIMGLEFRYILADNTPCANPCATPTQIRKVEVTLLARNSFADKTFKNTLTYTFPSNTTYGPYNDQFRRRMLTTRILARNMGF